MEAALSAIPMANLYRPVEFLFLQVIFLNLLLIGPLETVGLRLVSGRILGQPLTWPEAALVSFTANLATAILSILVLPDWPEAFRLLPVVPVVYVLSSFAEGVFYYGVLRRRRLRMGTVMRLSLAANLFTYVPILLLSFL